LNGLPDKYIHNNECNDTWSPFDVLGHLIPGEKTDWIPRAELILSDAKDKTFKPFNRFVMLKESEGKTMRDLLVEFDTLRLSNVARLEQLPINNETLKRIGIHPEFGEVTLEQLLNTWVTHDLGHIHQITRVMAKQNIDAVGPWKKYLGVLK